MLKELSMSTFFKYLLFSALLIFTFSCSDPQDNDKKSVQVPEEITLLFVTQPTCPSCDKLEKTMKLSKAKVLLEKYFTIKKVDLGEELPSGLIPPNGTPTVYFLGAEDEALLEPMVGEKSEEALMEFLEDALLEFKNLYNVDLVEKQKELKENNETTY
jgi:hypothetical protein